MKRLSWKYIAGLIDGEGCIDIQTSKGDYIIPRLRIHMNSTGKEVLECLKTNFKGNIYHKKSTNPNWDDTYSWELTGYVRVASLLRNIANHLIIKKEQARLILWCERYLKGKRLTEEVRKLVIEEIKAMKRDPHRLSEKAQDVLLRCDSRDN